MACEYRPSVAFNGALACTVSVRMIKISEIQDLGSRSGFKI